MTNQDMSKVILDKSGLIQRTLLIAQFLAKELEE